MSEYFIYFVTALLGSGHCIGMCGPIVLAYSVQLKSELVIKDARSHFASNHLLPHLSYNLGRVLMWVFLGMSLATAGSIITLLTNIENTLTICGGSLILLFGIGKIGFLPKFQFREQNSGWIFNFYHRCFNSLIVESSFTGKMALGLLNGLLPCGFSYAFLIKAAVSGSPLIAGFTMLSFGLGTIPALFVLGLFSVKISDRLRKWSEGLAAGVIILMGIVLILRGFGYHVLIFPPGDFGEVHKHFPN